MKFFAGIDAGATGTEIIVAAGSRKKYKSRLPYRPHKGEKVRRYKPVNINVLGLERSAARLADIIKNSVKGMPVSVAACVAGAGDESLRKRLERMLKAKTKIKNLKVYPDIAAAYASAFGGNNKTSLPALGRGTAAGVIIAGTGSVLYAGNLRVGGWGRIFGDEGSGYWIAREALGKVSQCYDGRGRRTQLTEALKKEFKLSAGNVVKKVYRGNFEIPRITKTVFKCAESGDRISRGIIKDAAEHLASHLIPIRNKKIKIALCGSLFSEERLLEKYFRKAVKDNFPGTELIKPKVKPVWGALRLAMRDKDFLNTENTKRRKDIRRQGILR